MKIRVASPESVAIRLRFSLKLSISRTSWFYQNQVDVAYGQTNLEPYFKVTVLHSMISPKLCHQTAKFITRTRDCYICVIMRLSWLRDGESGNERGK